MIKLKGLGISMVTPFLADRSIDFASLKKLTRFLINNGVDYLVVQGTTGESPTLSANEKEAVLNAIITENAGKLPIVYGIGGNNTMAIAEALENFQTPGVDAILSVSPYYNKPTQEGIYQHFKTLSEHAKLPIILYNVPGRTSSNVSASTTLRLANDFDNIIAIKEASGNLEQVMSIIESKPKDFLVISGDDALTMPFIAMGGDGVISVIGNGLPKLFSDMVQAGLTENHGRPYCGLRSTRARFPSP
jgi:4-hydroxy-tetrahydrodipicolinate synthase